MKSEFDYYYGAEAEQFSFVKIPKVLFSDKKHFGREMREQQTAVHTENRSAEQTERR